MWAGGDDAPLIQIRLVHLNLLICAASFVAIVTPCYINAIMKHAGSGVSHTYEVGWLNGYKKQSINNTVELTSHA